MTVWKLATFIAIATVPVATQAQDSSFPMPDYNATIGDAAQGAATMAAARGRTGGRQATGPRSRRAPAGQPGARARRDCAKARAFASDGVQHAQLPRMLGMCRQLGL